MPATGPIVYLDCARADPIAGVYRQGQLQHRLLERDHDDPRGVNLHAGLADMLRAHALTWQEVTAVAVGNGPGPMTGTRVGLAAAIGFCQALEIPALAVPAWFGYLDLDGPEQQKIDIPIGRAGVAEARITMQPDGWTVADARLRPGTLATPPDWQAAAVAAAIAAAPTRPVTELEPIYLRDADAEPQFDAFGRPLAKPMPQQAA